MKGGFSWRGGFHTVTIFNFFFRRFLLSLVNFRFRFSFCSPRFFFPCRIEAHNSSPARKLSAKRRICAQLVAKVIPYRKFTCKLMHRAITTNNWYNIKRLMTWDCRTSHTNTSGARLDVLRVRSALQVLRLFMTADPLIVDRQNGRQHRGKKKKWGARSTTLEN